MTYTNSFEEDRFLATVAREAEAFKKLIEDRGGMVIPIFNNNPRAPMADTISRTKTTYNSSRNAGGGEGAAERPRVSYGILETLVRSRTDRVRSSSTFASLAPCYRPSSMPPASRLFPQLLQ